MRANRTPGRVNYGIRDWHLEGFWTHHRKVRSRSALVKETETLIRLATILLCTLICTKGIIAELRHFNLTYFCVNKKSFERCCLNFF